jgi:hypothetical protein
MTKLETAICAASTDITPSHLSLLPSSFSSTFAGKNIGRGTGRRTVVTVLVTFSLTISLILYRVLSFSCESSAISFPTYL